MLCHLFYCCSDIFTIGFFLRKNSVKKRRKRITNYHCFLRCFDAKTTFEKRRKKESFFLFLAFRYKGIFFNDFVYYICIVYLLDCIVSWNFLWKRKFRHCLFFSFFFLREMGGNISLILRENEKHIFSLTKIVQFETS